MTRSSPSMLLAFLPLVLLTACQRADPPLPAKSMKPGPVADLGVLQAILKDGCDHPDANHSLDVYLDRPASFSPEDAQTWKWRPPGEFAVQLAKRSGGQVRWQRLMPCAIRQVVDAAKVDALIAQDKTIPPSYEFFYQAYPNCRHIVQLSMPAYSDDGRRAMVYEISKFEGWVSSGMIIELEGDEAEWHVTEKHGAWFHSF